jgi:hypothetical protein
MEKNAPELSALRLAYPADSNTMPLSLIGLTPLSISFYSVEDSKGLNWTSYYYGLKRQAIRQDLYFVSNYMVMVTVFICQKSGGALKDLFRQKGWPGCKGGCAGLKDGS